MASAQHGNPVVLGGVAYLVARTGPEGARKRLVTQSIVPSDPQNPSDFDKFTEVVPFGFLGMGSSLPAVRGQYDYSLDVFVEDWDELAPGPLQSTISGLTSSNAITAFGAVKDQSGNKYLYAGSSEKLFKVNLTAIGGGSAALTLVNTKTFTHAASPVVSDIVVLKDGYVLSGAARTTWATDAYVLVFFGASAAIAQIDTVGVDTAADTYRAAPANTAYGGVGCPALGSDNTQTLVYKSTGQASQTTGAFSLLQSAVVRNSPTTDYTNSGSWSGTVLVGEPGSPISRMVNYGRAPAIAKPEGVYQFNANGNAYEIFSTPAYKDDANGRHLLAWGRELIIDTIQDLKAIPSRAEDATAGLSTLLSNLSPVKGTVTATAAYGRYFFFSVYDGTDSYIVKARRRQGEDVPHQWLFYPVTKLSSVQCQGMAVVSDGATNGKVYLFYHSASGGNHVLGYCILDPVSSRTYATGGQWYSTRMGDPLKKTVIERVVAYGVSTGASNYWTISQAWDEGSFNSVGTVNAAGRTALNYTAGTNDAGYQYQFKAVATVAASSNRPRLRGANSSASGPGGLIVQGFRQADEVERITYTFVAAGRGGVLAFASGAKYTPTAAATHTALKALLTGGTTTLTDEDLFGDRTAVRVSVRSIKEVPAPKDAQYPEGRYFEVDLRRLYSG